MRRRHSLSTSNNLQVQLQKCRTLSFEQFCALKEENELSNVRPMTNRFKRKQPKYATINTGIMKFDITQNSSRLGCGKNFLVTVEKKQCVVVHGYTQLFFLNYRIPAGILAFVSSSRCHEIWRVIKYATIFS